MRRTLTLLPAILALCVFSSAWAEPVMLEYKFTKGELDKYRLSFDMRMNIPALAEAGMPKMDFGVSMVVMQRTLKVLPDGSGVVKMTYSDPKVTGLNMKQTQCAMPKNMSVVMTMARDGRILNVEGLEKMMGASGLSGMDFTQMFSQVGCYALFPTEPVPAGTLWRYSMPMPFGGGSIDINNTLISTDEQMWSLAAARIRQDFEAHLDLSQMMQSVAGMLPGNDQVSSMIAGMSGGLDMDGEIDFLFSPAKGKLLAAGGTITAGISIGMPQEAVKVGAPSSINMNMEIVLNVKRFN